MGFYYLDAESLARLLNNANEMGIKKEQYVDILMEDGYWCLIYYIDGDV